MHIIAGRPVTRAEPHRLTRKQEQSGVIAGYCVIALYLVAAWWGIVGLIGWVLG